MAGTTNQLRNYPNLTFQPHPLARNPHFQTIFSSMYRAKGTEIRQVAQEMILDAGEGVRLQGYYSRQSKGNAKGSVLLLHGWLGSVDASYVLTIGEYLYRQGYSIFRLNLRDHGDTHHLNPGPFRGDLLDEVFAATQRIAKLESNQPLHIIGASLGGNFALRLAWRSSQAPIPNLGHTITFCPVLNPYRSTVVLDNGFWLYLAYFQRKWRRSMQKKQSAFPDLFDFSEEIAAATCMTMTEVFVRNHSPYPNATAYFQRYTITTEMMAVLRTPTTIITAADDPIVPIGDFFQFYDLTPYLKIQVQPYGGHVGFIDFFPFQQWVCKAALAILES
jgi:predicted alpha/beta-fold hydrolase